MPQELYAEQIMVMPAIQKRWWTEKEVRQLIEDAPGLTPRYELVDGELLVTPSPSRDHQRVLRTLLGRLQEYVHRMGLGEALSSPSDVQLAAELVVQPDIYVLPRDAKPAQARERLLLAIEITSPGSARFDRNAKRRAYLAADVAEYWIIDIDGRTVERWRRGDERPEIADRELLWRPEAANSQQPFLLDVEQLFEDAELKGD